MPRFGRVVLGGTFDRLHRGHEALLASAFRAGRTVAVGVTTDAYLERHPKPDPGKIQPYRTRRATLRRWLSARYPARRWVLASLDDTFGRSVEDGVDAVVVSADTLSGGRAVNAERRRLGRRAVPLIVVPLVLADDLQPVSSRRIRAGTIDRDGRRRSSIRVGLAVGNGVDRAAAARGIRRAFARARVVPVRPGPAAPPSLARLRASARSAAARGELGVAVGAVASARRRILVASPQLLLAPRTVSGASPGELSAAIAGLLRRSSERNPFNPRRG